MNEEIKLATDKDGNPYFKGSLPKCKIHPRTIAMAWISEGSFKGHLCRKCIESGIPQGRLQEAV